MRTLLTNLTATGHRQGASATRHWRLARRHPTDATTKLVTTLLALLLSAALISPGLAQPPSEPVPTADQMQAFLAKRPEQDMIHWKNPERGESLEVRILAVSENEVSVQKTVQGSLASRTLPITEISDVSFARTPLEQRLIHHPTADAAPALRVLWNTRKPTLGMQSSNVADVAIALARALRMSRETAGLDEAADLLQHVVENDPADHRNTTAELELQTLGLVQALASGPSEEADRIAWAITESDGNTDAMLIATAWLADRHFEDLKQLELEHPRWDQDDEVRPIRWRLYHLSLDFALYPSLFHGTHAEEAANGLQKVWSIHHHTRSPELALQTLEDLAALYPDSQAAKDTAPELARMRARLAQGTLEEPTPGDSPAEDDPEASVDTENPSLPPAPPAPKRYNLFDD